MFNSQHLLITYFLPVMSVLRDSSAFILRVTSGREPCHPVFAENVTDSKRLTNWTHGKSLHNLCLEGFQTSQRPSARTLFPQSSLRKFHQVSTSPLGVSQPWHVWMTEARSVKEACGHNRCYLPLTSSVNSSDFLPLSFLTYKMKAEPMPSWWCVTRRNWINTCKFFDAVSLHTAELLFNSL